MENTLKAQSPLQLNLLDILAVNNVYSLHAFKFIIFSIRKQYSQLQY